MNTLQLLSYPTILALTAYFNISAEMVTALTILLVLDVITGIAREYVTNPHGLSSRVGIIGVLSKVLTVIIPLTLALAGKVAGINISTLVTSSVTVIAVYEAWSVLGNVAQIRSGDRTLGEYDAITSILKALQTKLKGILSSLIGEDKSPATLDTYAEEYKDDLSK